MRFLVFSDSHGSLHCMKEMLERNTGHLDGVFYLGDGYRDLFRIKAEFPDVFFAAVRGNCDTALSLCGETVQEHEVMSLYHHRILLTHGHRESCKYGDARLLQTAYDLGCDTVLHGHTHRQRSDKLQSVDGKSVKLCNPGAAKDGKFGILEITDTLFLFHGEDICTLSDTFSF